MPVFEPSFNPAEYALKVIHSIADPVFVKDREHQWILLNEAFCDFMGRKNEELIGKSDYDFFPRKEADVFWQKDEEVFLSGKENVNEEFFTDGAGLTRTIITKKTLCVDNQGNPFLVGIIRDVSELRQAVRESQQSYEKLLAIQSRMVQSEKMASLGQLVAGIAHEINNPTAYILSNLYTLQGYEQQIRKLVRIPPGDLTPDGIDMAMIMEDCPSLISETIHGAERIKKIIQDLRIFAHSSEGRFEHGDLHVCIDRALAILANELKYKVSVIKEYGDIPTVCFREQQILQVFVNLFSNAAQAIETAGTIRVRTWAKGAHILVEVKDSGKGITPQDLPRIFDPFFTTKPVGQGTGLGLSVVHGIIQKHGGEIMVSSEVGDGTIFTIKLLRDGPPAGALSMKE